MVLDLDTEDEEVLDAPKRGRWAKRQLTPGKAAPRKRSPKGTTRRGKALIKPVLNHSETVAELEAKKSLIIAGITPEKVAKATLPQMTIALGIIFDKLQILRGEPTQIISRDDRPALNKLAKDLMEISRARGIVIDAEFSEVKE